jgi:carbamoylphosphate synthase large subunit
MSSHTAERAQRIWLGAAGTGAAFGIAKALKERWGAGVWIVAADINPRHLVAAVAFADGFEQVPPVADPGFSSSLGERLARHCVSVYVPILDEEIVLAARLKEARSLPGALTAVFAPSAEAAELCHDKLASSHWLRDHGYPTPHTVEPRDAQWGAGSWIVKPRRGRGSAGFRRVESERDLSELKNKGGDVVVQESCSVPEVTVDAFISFGSPFERALCRERLEVKAGVCTKARIFEDQGLSDLALNIGRALGLRGTFCVQVMRSRETGKWLVTDINPRPGAGTSMSRHAGVDFLCAGFAELRGVSPASMLPRLASERYVVRAYAEYSL